MKKKVLSILMASTMALGLVACGGGAKQEAPAEPAATEAPAAEEKAEEPAAEEKTEEPAAEETTEETATEDTSAASGELEQ